MDSRSHFKCQSISWVHQRITDSKSSFKIITKLKCHECRHTTLFFYCNNARLVNNNLIWIISLHSPDSLSPPLVVSNKISHCCDSSTLPIIVIYRHHKGALLSSIFRVASHIEWKNSWNSVFHAIKFGGIQVCAVEKLKIWVMKTIRGRVTLNSIKYLSMEQQKCLRWNLIFVRSGNGESRE